MALSKFLSDGYEENRAWEGGGWLVALGYLLTLEKCTRTFNIQLNEPSLKFIRVPLS